MALFGVFMQQLENCSTMNAFQILFVVTDDKIVVKFNICGFHHCCLDINGCFWLENGLLSHFHAVS